MFKARYLMNIDFSGITVLVYVDYFLSIVSLWDLENNTKMTVYMLLFLCCVIDVSFCLKNLKNIYFFY